MILVVSVITWDLTHQSLSASGAEAPEGASAADGWLVTLDNRSELGALILVQDISKVGEDARIKKVGEAAFKWGIKEGQYHYQIQYSKELEKYDSKLF